MSSVSGRGPGVGAVARGFGFGVLPAAAVADLLLLGGGPTTAILAAGLVALLWPTARRPARLTPQLRTAVPALLSALYTAGVLLSGGSAPFGPGEVTVLLCLTFVAVRHCPRPWAVACGVLNGAALLATPVRAFRSTTGATLGYEVVLLALLGLTAGLAGYLRSLDYRRTVAVAETRRSERLAIAADLHDFVAHHVTGILVQTRVARMIAPTQPTELDVVLAGIEGAATEALASMRRTVGVLRDTGAEVGRRPVGDLAGIEDLTARFASPVQQVTLCSEVPADLPHEVQTAAFRVVQEALTNIRRHAADATEVTVQLGLDGGRLTVSVSDDGRGGTQLPDAAHGGGFGLVGLKERVTAVGGGLTAGPRDGGGWVVRATIPAG